MKTMKNEKIDYVLFIDNDQLCIVYKNGEKELIPNNESTTIITDLMGVYNQNIENLIENKIIRFTIGKALVTDYPDIAYFMIKQNTKNNSNKNKFIKRITVSALFVTMSVGCIFALTKKSMHYGTDFPKIITDYSNMCSKEEVKNIISTSKHIKKKKEKDTKSKSNNTKKIVKKIQYNKNSTPKPNPTPKPIPKPKPTKKPLPTLKVFKSPEPTLKYIKLSDPTPEPTFDSVQVPDSDLSSEKTR